MRGEEGKGKLAERPGPASERGPLVGETDGGLVVPDVLSGDKRE